MVRVLGKPEKDHPIYQAWETVQADVAALGEESPAVILLGDLICRAYDLGHYRSGR